MAFFKSLMTRRYHKKLEDPILGSDEDEYDFQVRYLGETPISESNSKKCTSQAVRNIVQMAKLNKGKGEDMKVTLTINPSGVRIHLGSSCCLLDIPLAHVSYCCADEKISHIFAFVSVSSTGDLKCYAFGCDSKKKAREIAVTLNKIFNSVYLDMKNEKRLPIRYQEANTDFSLYSNLNSPLLI